ncbi:response regulator [Planomonospora parontospora]|nr:response regulator transcription factor [Planomonospora parontospora]
MDVRMPRMDGLAATRELARRSPATRVVVVTTFENDQPVWGALRAGAVGHVLKRAPAAELVETVEEAGAMVRQGSRSRPIYTYLVGCAENVAFYG